MHGARGTHLEQQSIAMRTRLRILILAALVAAVVVPVDFALSLESSHRRAPHEGVEPVAHVVVSQPLTTAGAVVPMTRVPEGAKLFAIGTALFALAALMRRGSRAR